MTTEGWSRADIKMAGDQGWTIRLSEPTTLIRKLYPQVFDTVWIVDSIAGVFSMEFEVKQWAAEGDALAQRGLEEAARRHAVWRVSK